MKKRQLLCIVLGVALIFALSACSDATGTESSADVSASAESSESADASESASAESTSDIYDVDYNAWTAADWDAASSEQKYVATADIIREETEPATSLQQFVEDAKSDPGMDAEIIELEGLVEEAFHGSADGSTFDAVRTQVAIPGVN